MRISRLHLGHEPAEIRLSRRSLLLASGAGILAVASPAMAAAQSEDQTRVYVGHSARLTSRIPIAWSANLDGYAGEDGFISTSTVSAESLDEAWSQVILEWGISPTPTITRTTWQGQPVCRFETGEAGDPAVTCVLAHPHPFDSPDGHQTHVAISADAAHIDGIMQSLDFDPSLVTPDLYVQGALDWMQANSLFTTSIDWEGLRLWSSEQAKAVTEIPGAYPVMQNAIDVLRSVGDRHSQFISYSENEALATEPTPGFGFELSRDHVIAVFPESAAGKAGIQPGDQLVNVNGTPFDPQAGESQYAGEANGTFGFIRYADGTSYTVTLVATVFSSYLAPTGRLIEPDVGYLHIPRCRYDLPTWKQYVTDGADVLHGLDRDTTTSWIVDLRGNTGGSFHPMVTALAPLITEGPIVGFQDNSGATDFVSLAGQRLENAGLEAYELGPDRPYVLKNAAPPVAILIDENVVSSGELTGMAFAQQPATRFVGSLTAGYTSSNNALLLFDGSLLVLATTWMTDRTGTPYPDGIYPDDEIYSDAETFMLDTDPVIQVALDWLRAALQG
ncbi:MAG TPA: S41 family peptidase [Thermomicrobiales bacterium]|nr:S41 family peptidase [Thermomicrobiales bacterium]